MDAQARIESELRAALDRATTSDCPPTFAKALDHAVFPGGARVRPQLCLAVAHAGDDPDPALAISSASALELLHCASLVHDDLPAFDASDLRRGKPSVHAAYGEPLAILVGDALIVMAYETLARGGAGSLKRLPSMMSIISRSVGAPGGIVAGQAWESEASIPLKTYHRAKTGALFVGATMAGAIAGGSDPGPWRLLGEKIGEAYQVADDLLDAVGAAEAGKPMGQDNALDRPSSCREMGIEGALTSLKTLVAEAVEAVPDCKGADALRELVCAQAKRLAPKSLIVSAA